MVHVHLHLVFIRIKREAKVACHLANLLLSAPAEKFSAQSSIINMAYYTKISSLLRSTNLVTHCQINTLM